MSRAPHAPPRSSVADRVLGPPSTSLVDLVDSLLDRGVMATGDLTLGVAGVDLIYVRLSALLCASDRVLPKAAEKPTRRRRRRR